MAVGIVIGALLTLAPKLLDRSPMDVALKSANEAYATLVNTTHAAHRATNLSLQERVARLQVERDHYFQTAHALKARLEREKIEVAIPEAPGEAPQDGVEVYQRHLRETAPAPAGDNVEQG